MVLADGEGAAAAPYPPQTSPSMIWTGVLAARVPHAEDQEPLAEGRAGREASVET